MNTISHYILPRLDQISQQIGEDPSRVVFPRLDFSTLVALLILSIVFKKGRRLDIIGYVQNITGLGEAEIQFALDQYEGKHPRHHLWRRDASGRYRLLI